MDRQTVRIYEDHATAWAARRAAQPRRGTPGLVTTVPPDAVRVDLGCGAGHFTPDLGTPIVALDAAFPMLRLARAAAPDALAVQADLEDLPFRPGALSGGWARNSYLHVPPRRLPLALAQLHRAMVVGAPLELSMKEGDYAGYDLPGDDFPGRFFAFWPMGRLTEVVSGAGFEITAQEQHGSTIAISARRLRTLPDFVGPDMSILMVGLNPSLRSADVGVGYAGPSNRFWGAAIDAGLVTRTRDPWHALRHHGMGMTDLVKRATVGAAELRPVEYRDGKARVERLVRWLEPKVVCFVGLAGFRAAVDRRARPGVQPEPFGGAVAYVLASTSGLNARTSRAELTDHLRAALALTA